MNAMQASTFRSLAVSLMMAGAASFAVSVSAADALIGQGAPSAASAGISGTGTGPADSGTRNAFGIQDFLEMNVSPHGFTPLQNGEQAIQFDNWAYRSGGSNTAACHSPVFPMGAALYGITVWINDNNASAELQYDLDVVNLLNNTYTNTLDYNSGVAATGITRLYVAISGGPVTYTGERQAARLCIYNPTTDGTLQYSGVTYWYKRQISPAPGSATFSDVPIGYWAFRHVEALYASGITAGCGGSSFCPNATVTRAEMAVFLAKALGLHYGY